MKRIYLLMMLSLASLPLFACDDPATIQKLQQTEQNKLLENAPTFKHAWEDQKITLHFAESKMKDDHCTMNMTITLAPEDINQVRAYLDNNPAKRILLGAQGYGVPEETTTVAYLYQADGTDFNEKNQALNQLHNNIEFTYQTLAQERAVIPDNASNKKPWSQAITLAELSNCEAAASKQNQPNIHCSCRVQKLSEMLNERQMELVHFIQSQPYSAATGVLSNFNKMSSNINNACHTS